MRALEEVLDSLRTWVQPSGDDDPFKLACRLEPGARREELDAAPTHAGDQLLALWSATREAWLFEDTEYGQWGLHLLAPAESSSRTSIERVNRRDDFRTDDVVLGEFLGDSELLVFAPSEVAQRRYLIALPLDPREDWFAVGASAAEVLERYLVSDGEKYWEQGS